ncbi:diguanylate cyclase [Lysobacter enzymogenes]|uniref:diguanylate cyclase n=1 Tax=Lysobacter enzymogenes TaxID=69 RepID=UPI001AF0E22E|nr:diguanylate cyclase [Lysobacter enzymogenes]QQQ00323.1 diguanylate cyclase [Lysobacter enzymogenes]
MQPAVRRGLYRQFLGLLVMAVVLPSLAFGAAMVLARYRAELDEIDARTAASAHVLAHELDESLAALQASLHVLAAAGARHRLDWSVELPELQRRYPPILTLIATDARGRVIGAAPAAAAARAVGLDVSDRDYFRQPARSGRDYISDAFVGRGLGSDPLVVVSVPRYRDGAFAGVIEASLAPAHVYDENGHGDYETVLLDRAGRVIHASGGIGLKFMQRAADTGFAPALAQRDAGAARRAVPVMPDGGHAFVAAARTRGGWTLYAVAPRELAARPALERAMSMIQLLLLAVLGAALAFVWYARMLARASSLLLQRLRALASGAEPALGLPAGDVPMPEELQPVLAAIVDLSTRLDHAHAELRQSLAEREHDVAQRTEQLRAALRELDRVACTDPLTGALNRRGRDEFVQALAAQGARLGSVAVLLLDVDHFKAYNDRYGHRAGDEALRTAVAAIRAEVREGDDAVVRAGGEEFCVLIPGVGRARVLNIARAILLGLYRRDIEHRDSEHGRLTCSIGVAMAYSVDELDAAMDRADEALYRAKRRGRNGFCS